jgi:hypothetical protein
MTSEDAIRIAPEEARVAGEAGDVPGGATARLLDSSALEIYVVEHLKK